MKTITTQDLQKRIGQDLGLHLWNVTGEQYFKGESIPGSRYVPVERLGDALKGASLSKDAPIIVYCAGPTCPASKMAAEKLEAFGFTNVTKYEGGIEEWKKSGLGITEEECTTGSCATSSCETASCETTTEKKRAGGGCGSC